MIERLGFDHPKHSRDEATELCIYHLRMAAGLFQLVPDDDNQSLLDELKRQCDNDDVVMSPARAWAREIFAIYKNMKDRD